MKTMRPAIRLRLRPILGLTAILAVLGPASPVARASDKYARDESVKLESTRKPAPGKALIYFVRTQTFGAAVKVKLYADDTFVGILGSKTFIPYECEPGAHHFAGVAENAGLLDAEVAADRVYVVQVSLHMGAWKARTHFEVARDGSEALGEFTKTRDDLVGVKVTDEGRKWAEEDAASDKEKMVKYRQSGEVETMKPGDGRAGLP